MKELIKDREIISFLVYFLMLIRNDNNINSRNTFLFSIYKIKIMKIRLLQILMVSFCFGVCCSLEFNYS